MLDREGSFKDVFGLFGGADVATQGKVVEGFNEAAVKNFELGALKGFIHTKIGDGPRVLTDAEALLNSDGFPKSSA
ncbi:hypothetical protein C0991_011350 [Blastosporella zonata]|nr:hypothetical protein C0991_011350 [Blastosporella zonata]